MQYMAKIVGQAIKESAPDGKGLVTSYFRDAREWEGAHRERFRELTTKWQTGDPDLSERTFDCLRHLNGAYRTRCAVAHLRPTAGMIVRHLSDQDWLKDAPGLLGSNSERAQQVAHLVADLLARIHAGRTIRPYSLLTKFLHFTFPDTFPIYDSQAASSIQMWSYFEYARGTEAAQQKYSYDGLIDSSGRQYQSIVDFYRAFWDAASDEQRARLQQHAARLTQEINGGVSVLDVLDKLLWRASGNPINLGLCTP